MNYSECWDYLPYYNNTDVEIMVACLINLINQNAEYHVDLQHNLSLSFKSSIIKYMPEYKDFAPHNDYCVKITTSTFKPTLKW